MGGISRRIKSVTDGSLIDKRNKSSLGPTLEPGDILMEVNSVSGDSDRILAEMKASLSLELKIAKSETSQSQPQDMPQGMPVMPGLAVAQSLPGLPIMPATAAVPAVLADPATTGIPMVNPIMMHQQMMQQQMMQQKMMQQTMMQQMTQMQQSLANSSASSEPEKPKEVSDTSRIVCFDRHGCFRSVASDLEPHHIIPNETAGTISTILEASNPLYGPDVCPNGGVVHHPSTSRLERRSPNGELAASVEGSRGKVISFEANSYLTAGQDGHVYFSSKTCIYRWNTQERTVKCIAGHLKASGRRDGFGSGARFTHLKRPVLTRRFAYVRESDNRFCRIDLETFEVSTLQLRGVENTQTETYGVTPCVMEELGPDSDTLPS